MAQNFFSVKDGFNKLNNIIKYHNPVQIRNLLLNNDARMTQIFNVNAANRLIFTPLNLIVCEDQQEVEQALNDVYYPNNEALSLGINAFYAKVRSRFCNVTRSQCSAFLHNQPEYQATFKAKKVKVNKKITSDHCNHKWQLDLIDFSIYANGNNNNNRRKYLVHLIDLFSQKSAIYAIVNKTAQSIINALNIIIPQQMGNTFPQILISDNGPEFRNALMTNWCQQNNVQHILTMSHHPTQNAWIEQAHSKVRAFLRALFIRNNNNFNWTNHLHELLAHLNSRKNSSTGYSADELWIPGHQPILRVPLTNSLTETHQEKQLKVYDKQRGIARDVARSMQASDLHVGDTVRVLNSELFPAVRRKLKNEIEKKQIVVKWSGEIYTVSRVVNGDMYTPRRYELQVNGNNLMTQNNGLNVAPVVRKWYRYHLQPVNNVVPNLLTNQDTNRLNKT